MGAGTTGGVNLDPHMARLADVLVGICVRELSKEKRQGISCLQHSLGVKDVKSESTKKVFVTPSDQR